MSVGPPVSVPAHGTVPGHRSVASAVGRRAHFVVLVVLLQPPPAGHVHGGHANGPTRAASWPAARTSSTAPPSRGPIARARSSTSFGPATRTSTAASEGGAPAEGGPAAAAGKGPSALPSRSDLALPGVPRRADGGQGGSQGRLLLWLPGVAAMQRRSQLRGPNEDVGRPPGTCAARGGLHPVRRAQTEEISS